MNSGDYTSEPEDALDSYLPQNEEAKKFCRAFFTNMYKTFFYQKSTFLVYQ
jgi:hypothetical protein